MGEHVDPVGGQCQSALGALGREWRAAVEGCNVLGRGGCAISALGQQNPYFFKAFADGGNRLRQSQIALGGAPKCVAVGLRVCRVNATAGKHISPRGKAGGHGAPGHQHLQAIGAVPKEQHGGRRTKGNAFALGMKELTDSAHDPLSFAQALWGLRNAV